MNLDAISGIDKVAGDETWEREFVHKLLKDTEKSLSDAMMTSVFKRQAAKYQELNQRCKAKATADQQRV